MTTHRKVVLKEQPQGDAVFGPLNVADLMSAKPLQDRSISTLH